uniref:Secreted protein n=1 Tax=Haemonchus contortus TaxID=6289 RepID=A0A7I4YDU3_HAECO
MFRNVVTLLACSLLSLSSAIDEYPDYGSDDGVTTNDTEAYGVILDYSGNGEFVYGGKNDTEYSEVPTYLIVGILTQVVKVLLQLVFEIQGLGGSPGNQSNMDMLGSGTGT